VRDERHEAEPPHWAGYRFRRMPLDV
jgi:hypothetical protein